MSIIKKTYFIINLKNIDSLGGINKLPIFSDFYTNN